MQPRGYSDFFKSGFSAIIHRSCGRASSSQNSDVVFNTPKTTSYGATSTERPRPVSMVVQTTPRDKARRRRSSLLSFNSSFNEKRMMPRTQSLRTVESGDSLPDRVTVCGPYPPMALNGRYISHVLSWILLGSNLEWFTALMKSFIDPSIHSALHRTQSPLTLTLPRMILWALRNVMDPSYPSAPLPIVHL